MKNIKVVKIEDAGDNIITVYAILKDVVSSLKI